MSRILRRMRRSSAWIYSGDRDSITLVAADLQHETNFVLFSHTGISVTDKTSFGLEVILSAFEANVQSSQPKSIEEFVEVNSIDDLNVIAQLVQLDIRLGYHHSASAKGTSSRREITTYFDAFPSLVAQGELASEILLEEFRVRFLAGECHELRDFRTGNSDLDQIIEGIQKTRRSEFDSSFAAVGKESIELTSPAPEPSALRNVADNPQLQVGQRIRHYELTEVINLGHKASVYQARDLRLDRLVVLKTSDPLNEAAQREARFMARLEHPNILAIHEEFQEEGRQFIVIPFVNGVSLDRLIQSWQKAGSMEHPELEKNFGDLKGKQKVIRVVEIVKRLAAALGHAHNNGVLHCDVKPSNVLIDGNGIPLLMDFDIAINSDSGSSTLGGTLGYMSPEQSRFLISKNAGRRRGLDHRSDLYSLGRLFIELLTGKLPDDDHTRVEVVGELKQVAGVTAALRSIVCRCLENGVEERYQSASQLETDLDCWLKGLPLKFAPDTNWLERAVRWARRNPLAAAGASLLLTVGISWFIGSTMRMQRIEHTIDRLESRLISSQWTDIHELGEELLATQAQVSSTGSWIPALSARQQKAKARMQVALWNLARREDELLAKASVAGMVTPVELKSNSSPSSLDAVLTELETVWGGRVPAASVLPGAESIVSACEDSFRWLLNEHRVNNQSTDRLSIQAKALLVRLFPSLNPLRVEAIFDSVETDTLDKFVGGLSFSSDGNSQLTDFEWHLFGVIYEFDGRLELASECFEKAIQRRQDDGRLPRACSIRQLANAQLKLERHELALRTLEIGAEIDSNPADYIYRIGLVLQQTANDSANYSANYSDSLRYLQEAVRLSPSNKDYHADLGAVLIRTQQSSRALVSLNKAIELGKTGPEVRLNVAVAKYLAGRVDEAIRDLEKYSALYPENQKIRELLSKLRTRSSR